MRPGSGIYKTTDGGKTFKKLTKGLPTCKLGRIGLDCYRKDPNVVYAIVDCEKIGKAPPARPRWPSTALRHQLGEDEPGEGRPESIGDRRTVPPTRPVSGRATSSQAIGDKSRQDPRRT